MYHQWTRAALRRGVPAAIAALSLLLAPAAFADSMFGGVPEGGTEPWRTPPGRSGPARPAPSQPSGPTTSRAAAAEPAVHFVGFMGYDIGSTRLYSATLSDGSTRAMDANQGFDASVGIAFLKVLDGRLATQATIGIEGWSITASDGSLQWLAFPLDVMEYVYLDPIRIGAGVSYLIAPRISGTGVLSSINVPLENSLGWAVGGDWVFRFPASARAARMTIGGRYVFQDLRQKAGGPAVSANSFAILLGFTG